MSERPENPSDEQENAQGGWHSPRAANPWQETETQAATAVQWRTVKALPDDLDNEPEERGTWHLPDEADTSFSPDDEVTVNLAPRPQPTSSAASARPEDLIAEILGQKATAAPRPEDFVIPKQESDEEEATEAADTFDANETLLVDEEVPSLEDDSLLDMVDDEEFTMSEYMALASLAQGDDDMTGVDEDDLSPAERAYFGIASQIDSEMAGNKISDGDTVTLDDTSQQEVNQAEDYARQQLAALQGGGESDVQQFEYQEQPTPEAQQPQYTPEQIQLAQQFRETKRQVAVLRQMQAQGQIDQNELQTRLQQHTILDPQGNWWMIGYETDEWYRFNNVTNEWEAAQPPVPLDAGTANTETGLGAAAPDVMAGSLPYLPDDGSQAAQEYSEYDGTQYSQSQQNYSNQYGIDETPIPNPGQQQIDPNLTQVGNVWGENTLPHAEPTLQNLNYVDQTIASDTYQEQQTMPSASLGDLARDDGYSSVPQAEPRPQATGFEDYGAQGATPTYEDLSARRNQQVVMYAGLAVFGFVILALLTVGGFFLYAMTQYNSVVEEWRDEIAALGNQDFDFQTTTILAADGTTIAEITSEEGARTVVSIENGEVSPFFVHAVVSSEDPRFYENPGFDVFAIARAFWQNLTAGEIQSGASTITQQIVRERVLGSNQVTFDRKLVEALLALEVANTYSKNEILDIYINEFFYGEQSYGVEAASQFYFDTSAADLNAAQAATLAGILPRPSDTNPVVAPLVAFTNMRVILNRMTEANCLDFQHGVWAQTGEPFCINEDTIVDDGAGGQTTLYRLNSDGTYRGLLALQIAEVETRDYEQRQSDILYPHFVFYVLGQLDLAYGPGAYIERGFTVQTTLVPRIQDAAEAALQQGVRNLALNGVQTGAALVTDPTTGAIYAMVGSPDFNNEEIDGQNNNTLSFQQPGSAIKPVVYATALQGSQEAGYYTPASILWDVPSPYNVGGTIYEPVNFDGRNRGPVPVRFALAQSLNIPAVKTYDQFSASFVNTANAMGINFDPIPDDGIEPTFGLPTAIGATEVSLMDLTHAYATIANDGVRVELFAVDSITERNNQPVELVGNLLHDVTTQAISPQTAYLLQNIMSDDNARSATLNGVPSTFRPNSPISGASLGLPNQGALAAKTGTNNTATATGTGNPSRIWTVGFTNNYAVGVWLGTVQQGTPLAGNVTGLTGASPVWNQIMGTALNGRNPGTFDAPTGVVQDTICQITGTLASANSDCPTRITEIYIQSQPPLSPEAGFVATLNVDSWTGQLANQWCAENVVTDTFANISDPAAVVWLNSNAQGRQILNLLNLPENLQSPPAEECQQGQPLPTVAINFPQENTTLTGNVAITGQVSASNLQRWELQISEVGTENFRSIMPQAATNQVPTGGSVLYEWDSTTVQNGAYILRLAAFSNANGGFIFRDVRVQVQNVLPTATPIPPTPVPVVLSPIPFDNTLPTSIPTASGAAVPIVPTAGG